MQPSEYQPTPAITTWGLQKQPCGEARGGHALNKHAGTHRHAQARTGTQERKAHNPTHRQVHVHTHTTPERHSHTRKHHAPKPSAFSCGGTAPAVSRSRQSKLCLMMECAGVTTRSAISTSCRAALPLYTMKRHIGRNGQLGRAQRTAAQQLSNLAALRVAGVGGQLRLFFY